MSSTFEEDGGRALIERFKLELRREMVVLDKKAERELTQTVRGLLLRAADPKELLGVLTRNMQVYVGQLVERGTLRRNQMGLRMNEFVIVDEQDLQVALAECPFCRGPVTRERSTV